MKKANLLIIIVWVIVVLCFIDAIVTSCQPAVDGSGFSYTDDNVFRPQIFVDDAHDVVCYRNGGNIDCVYIGAK